MLALQLVAALLQLVLLLRHLLGIGAELLIERLAHLLRRFRLFENLLHIDDEDRRRCLLGGERGWRGETEDEGDRHHAGD